MKQLLTFCIGFAVPFAVLSTKANAQSATCPGKVIMMPTAPSAGAQGPAKPSGVYGCIGEKTISFDAPEAMALRTTQTYGLFYNTLQAEASNGGNKLQAVKAVLQFAGVGQSVRIHFAFVGPTYSMDAGSVGGSLLVDNAGNFVVTGVSRNLDESAPGKDEIEAARKTVFNYAADEAFQNILDESSRVKVSLSGVAQTLLVFTATATNPGAPNCTVEIKYNRLQHQAFQEKIMPCQNLE